MTDVTRYMDHDLVFSGVLTISILKEASVTVTTGTTTFKNDQIWSDYPGSNRAVPPTNISHHFTYLTVGVTSGVVLLSTMTFVYLSTDINRDNIYTLGPQIDFSSLYPSLNDSKDSTITLTTSDKITVGINFFDTSTTSLVFFLTIDSPRVNKRHAVPIDSKNDIKVIGHFDTTRDTLIVTLDTPFTNLVVSTNRKREGHITSLTEDTRNICIDLSRLGVLIHSENFS